MGIKISMDTESIIQTMRGVGRDATDAAFAVLKDEGREIRDLAREYAPIDEGDLEAAIIMQSQKSENQVHVGIDPSAVDKRGVPINSYGAAMHELLAPFGAGLYNLGKRSSAKDAGRGKVGGKFLTRAFRERAGKILGKAAIKVKRIFK